jgi:preprotein translocase subunit SecG
MGGGTGSNGRTASAFVNFFLLKRFHTRLMVICGGSFFFLTLVLSLLLAGGGGRFRRLRYSLSESSDEDE